jgi:hypothetical protein
MIDIQAGDVVVCVDDGGDPLVPRSAPCRFIKKGAHYRVEDAWVYHERHLRLPVLKLSGVMSETVSGGYGIWRFQKLDKATDDFTARIKAIRPIKQREDA